MQPCENDNIQSYYPMQYPGKLMNYTCDNGKKPNFGLDFGLFGPNLGP